MSYYLSKTAAISFETAEQKIRTLLAQEGFGVLTEIDVQATLKKKLNVDFRNYKILGACNPAFAHQALLTEDKIGVMLPCNVIIMEAGPGTVEVASIDPVASLAAVGNEGLKDIASQIRDKLRRVIESL
jgi:uncharacterized protein (DUF302 family)